MGARQGKAGPLTSARISLEDDLLDEPVGPRLVYDRGGNRRADAGDFDESKHPRDENGRFSSGGGGGGAHEAMGHALTGLAEKHGGFSYRPGAGNERVPKSGYMVSLPPGGGLNHVVEIRDLAKSGLTGDALRAEVDRRVGEWLDKAAPAVQGMPDHYLGGWMERDEGGRPVAFHLDVSHRVNDRDQAIATGKANNQMAIWDVAKGAEVPTGGTGREGG